MDFYEFPSLEPVNVTGGSGGEAGVPEFSVNAGGGTAFNLILVFSFTGATLDIANTSTLLLTIDIPSAAGSDICLSDVVGELGLTNEEGGKKKEQM